MILYVLSRHFMDKFQIRAIDLADDLEIGDQVFLRATDALWQGASLQCIDRDLLCDQILVGRLGGQATEQHPHDKYDLSSESNFFHKL